MIDDYSATVISAVKTTVYGIPIRNVWHMLLYAWNEPPPSPYWRMSVEESPSLDALLTAMLLKLIRQRLRIGIGASYVPEQRMLRGVRGRIHFTSSLKQRAFERGQAYCEFEQYSINAPKNQIIRSTLFHLVRAGQFGSNLKQAEELRHATRWMMRVLDGIDLIELTPDFIQRQQMERHDRDYRIMLAICNLILQRQLPTEDSGNIYLSQLERDRLTLHHVYEQFINNFYRHHLQNWTVRSQKTLSWHEKTTNVYLPIMRPDLVLEENETGRIVILDTKFTAKSLKTNQWGKEIFDSSHLYQIYAYLKTQEHFSEQHRQMTGILLYPAIRGELSEKIKLQGQHIRIECVDLAVSWQRVEQRLLDVMTGVD